MRARLSSRLLQQHCCALLAYAGQFGTPLVRPRTGAAQPQKPEASVDVTLVCTRVLTARGAAPPGVGVCGCDLALRYAAHDVVRGRWAPWCTATRRFWAWR
jgi:hypothetical protein